jgi:general secretion pathway protein K
MKQKPRQTMPNGFVVVVVLCMIMMLTVLLLGFNSRCRGSLYAADGFRRSEQALNCAIAGVNIAIAAIKSTDDVCADSKLSKLFSAETVFPVGQGHCKVAVCEENGRLNVNLLKDTNGQLDRTRIDQFLRLIDLLNEQSTVDSHIGYGLVPSIIDWTDSDDEITRLPFVKYENAGAESAYYSSLNTPYQCRNKPLETVDELLLVKGITQQVYSRISDYITVSSDGKININCTPKLVIESLSEKIDPALAEIIIKRRKIKPFESIIELQDVPGMTDSIYYEIHETITVSPADRYYHITSEGSSENASHTTVAIVHRDTKSKTINVLMYKEIE